MKQIPGVDISNWQGPVTQDRIDCWKRNGIEHVVVRGSLETQAKTDLANQQLDASVQAGFGVSLYLWMYLSWNPLGTVDAGLRLFGHHPLAYWFLDCEEQTDIGSPAQNVGWINAALGALAGAGKLGGMYTGGWWWRPYTANDTTVAVPLWTADYDKDPDLSVYHPYGGFTGLIGKQWDVGPLCDLAELDRDTFDADMLYPQPIPSYPLEQYAADAANAIRRAQRAKAEIGAGNENLTYPGLATEAEYRANAQNAIDRYDRGIAELEQAKANVTYD